jgi:Zn finger protein HypA/HybF involved in hydrogenase expression
MIGALIAWWVNFRCNHCWRPALTSKGPAKYCPHCHTTTQLSEADFYAVFGRMPIL